ncbi:MAG: 3'-5' exonuclease [Candidatus Dormibacteria bacterium]
MSPAQDRHYGRRRGPVPVGNQFISRLGPAGSEPFASLYDPGDETLIPRPALDTPVELLRYVALDCETTGQTPHHLVELGAVAFTFDRHLLSFETLVHSNDRINPYARRIHGISRETLNGAPPVGRVLERFSGFVQGSVLVEHSADAFDTRLIARTAGTALDADSVDTTRLAAKLWGLKDTIGLERLCERLGVTHRKPHHALADAEATAACFLGLVAAGREQFGWRTLGDLLADGQPPQLRIAEAAADQGGNNAAQPASRPEERSTERRRRRH